MINHFLQEDSNIHVQLNTEGHHSPVTPQPFVVTSFFMKMSNVGSNIRLSPFGSKHLNYSNLQNVIHLYYTIKGQLFQKNRLNVFSFIFVLSQKV